MKSISKKRIAYIDLAEAWAMLTLVMYHSATYDFRITGPNVSPMTMFLFWQRCIVSASVPIFFVRNGYLLFSKDFNLRKHVRKTIRLVIIAFIWGLIDLLVIMPAIGEEITIIRLISNLFKWNHLSHFWYIGTLVGIYCMFPLLKVAFDEYRKAFYCFVIVCLILAFGNSLVGGAATILVRETLHWDKNYTSSVDFFTIFNFLKDFRGEALVYFCIGGVLPEIFDWIKQHFSVRAKNIIAGVIALGSVTCLSLWARYHTIVLKDAWDSVFAGQDTIFTGAMVLSLLVLFENYQKENGVLARIAYPVSVNSLVIYFLHEAVIYGTQPWWNRIPNTTNLLANLVYGILVIGGCVVIAKILKSNKITSWLC